MWNYQNQGVAQFATLGVTLSPLRCDFMPQDFMPERCAMATWQYTLCLQISLCRQRFTRPSQYNTKMLCFNQLESATNIHSINNQYPNNNTHHHNHHLCQTNSKKGSVKFHANNNVCHMYLQSIYFSLLCHPH